MTYDTVVFDNDGVLVGRTRFDVLRAGTREAFEALDVPEPEPHDVELVTVGATPHQVSSVCGQYDLEPERFWRARERSLTRAQQVEAREGRKTPYDDLDVLADLDVEMGVVSSNQHATVEFLLDHFEVADHFGAVYGREPTLESLTLRKPNSHYIDRALADLDADSALYVGDNESDVLAAHNAGIDSAFVRRPHRSDWDLESWPTWDIDSLEALRGIVGA